MATATKSKTTAKVAKVTTLKASGKASSKPLVASASEESRFKEIELRAIVASTTNPRKHFGENEINELADSIARHGVLQPVLLRPIDSNEYEIVAGERRVRAARLAGLRTVPANVLNLTDKEVLEIQVVENLQRADITPIEEAQGYAALVGRFGYSPATLADRIGKSPSYVAKRMKLTTLPEKARTAMEEGRLPIAQALILARLNPEVQEKALQSFFAGNMVKTVEECRRLAMSLYMLRLVDVPFDTKNAALHGGACQTCQYRTGSNTQLFDDFSQDDVCTNRTCYDAKIAEWWDGYFEKDAVKLPLNARETVFETYGNYLKLRCGYVAVDDRSISMPDGETYESLFASKATKYLVLDRSNKVRNLFAQQEIEELLANEPKVREEREKATTFRESQNQDRVIASRFSEALQDEIYTRAGERVGDLMFDTVLRLICEGAYRRMDDIEGLLRRHQIPEVESEEECESHIRELIQTSHGDALVALTLECLGLLDLYDGVSLLPKILQTFGLDLDQIKRDVAARVGYALPNEVKAVVESGEEVE